MLSNSKVGDRGLDADVEDWLFSVAVDQEAAARGGPAPASPPTGRGRDKGNDAHTKSLAILVQKFTVPFVHLQVGPVVFEEHHAILPSALGQFDQIGKVFADNTRLKTEKGNAIYKHGLCIFLYGEAWFQFLPDAVCYEDFCDNLKGC